MAFMGLFVLEGNVDFRLGISLPNKTPSSCRKPLWYPRRFIRAWNVAISDMRNVLHPGDGGVDSDRDVAEADE